MENKKWTWRDELAGERGSHFGGDFSVSYDAVTKRMKEKYPGNYIVEDYYNSKSHTFDLHLKFETPEDKTLFLLTYE